MKRGKKFLLVHILDLIKEGKNPAQISKLLNISKQNLNYYVEKLKKLDCIEKKGYGVWEFKREIKEVKIRPKDTRIGKGKKEIRGHAFIWKIQFYKTIDWGEFIKKSSLNFQVIGRGKVYRILFKNRKIWLTTKGMIIYEPMDYLGISSFQVKGTAVYEMDKLVKAILKTLKIKWTHYKFTTSREHYGIIKNELARQHNEKKEKLYIRGEDGDIWLWIDDSLSLGELENNEPVVNRQVQNWWNDKKAHGFKVTDTFLLNSMNQVTQNQIMFDKNFQSHLEVINKLGTAVDELRKEIKNLTVNGK